MLANGGTEKNMAKGLIPMPMVPNVLANIRMIF